MLLLLAAIIFGGLEFRAVACPDEPYCETQLEVRGGPTPRTIPFEVGEGPYSRLEVRPVQLPNDLGDALLAVASQPGGSDVRFETTLLAVRDGEAVQLLPNVPTTSQDALCIGTFGGQAGVLVMKFVWNDESHYAPHRYDATVYAWDGTEFRKTSTRQTSEKHSTWQSAANSLGYRCRVNLVELLATK